MYYVDTSETNRLTNTKLMAIVGECTYLDKKKKNTKLNEMRFTEKQSNNKTLKLGACKFYAKLAQPKTRLQNYLRMTLT